MRLATHAAWIATLLLAGCLLSPERIKPSESPDDSDTTEPVTKPAEGPKMPPIEPVEPMPNDHK